jgi:hypothetical protein
MKAPADQSLAGKATSGRLKNNLLIPAEIGFAPNGWDTVLFSGRDT